MENIDYNELFIQALYTASFWHWGQKDKLDKPYIQHLISVSNKMSDKKLQSIALLHDIIEDTKINVEQLIERFGKLAEIVMILTRQEETYMEYIERVSQNETATIVKIADLEVNLEDCPSETLKKRYEKALKKLKGE